MKYIISNKQNMPVDITTDDFEKMSYEELSSEGRKGLERLLDEVEEIYFDMNDMDEILYNELAYRRRESCNIKFFGFRKGCLNIHLASDIYTDGNILVSGMPGQGKSTLLKNMAIQLCNKGTSVIFISSVPVFNKSDNIDINKNTVDVTEFAKIVEDLQNEIMNRFKMMEQQDVNHVFKLNNVSVQPKVLIIDGLDFYMNSTDYTSVDIIKHGLENIASLGRSAGITLIISCHRPSGSVISSDLKHNIMNNIIVGKIADNSTTFLMFDKDIDINVPFGKGIYQDKCKYAESDDDFLIFNIEDVKNYRY